MIDRKNRFIPHDTKGPRKIDPHPQSGRKTGTVGDSDSINLRHFQWDNMLEKFKSYKDRGAVLLAIAKANFGESVDLPGDLLKAVIVVGLPLNPPDLETKALIQYYQDKFGRGMDYGYFLPAIIQLLQNAGRCIRSETDKGVIVFLEERLNSEFYQRLLPEDHYIVTNTPVEKVKAFFEAKSLKTSEG